MDASGQKHAQNAHIQKKKRVALDSHCRGSGFFFLFFNALGLKVDPQNRALFAKYLTKYQEVESTEGTLEERILEG